MACVVGCGVVAAATADQVSALFCLVKTTETRLLCLEFPVACVCACACCWLLVEQSLFLNVCVSGVRYREPYLLYSSTAVEEFTTRPGAIEVGGDKVPTISA